MPRRTGRGASAPIEPGSIGCRPYHEHAPARKAAGRDSRYAKSGHRRIQYHRIPTNRCHRTQRVHNRGWSRSPHRTSDTRRGRGTQNRRHKDLGILPSRSAWSSTDRSLHWANNPRSRASWKSCIRYWPHPPGNQEGKTRSRKYSAGPQRIDQERRPHRDKRGPRARTRFQGCSIRGSETARAT